MTESSNIQNISHYLQMATNYLSQHPQVIAAYLFGSYAAHNSSSFSDVDIAILLKPDENVDKIHKIEERIYLDLYKIFRSVELDLITLNLAPLSLRFEAIKNGKLLCSNDHDMRIEFESYTLRKYWDFKVYQMEYDSAFIERLKENFDETQYRQYHRTFEKVRSVHQRIKETSEARPKRV